MAELNPKAVWPGWTTVKIIGKGSFGSVYEIERELVGETEKAALKVISIPQDENDIEELRTNGLDEESITAHFDDYLKDIIREYSLMTKIKGHTNVVYCDDIHYVQKDDGIGWDIFIKMELLTPLTKALGTAYSEEEVIKVGRDIANALVLCKNRNIVHRDIKPQNIFVSDDGAYKLGDFGIARTMEKTSAGTRGIGTLNYMAPEVHNDQPYGHTADIYSLGLVLYWLLNDQRMPFLPLPPAILKAADTENARVLRFSGAPVPAPAHGCEELKRIVLKACAFDPKERYQSASEMLEDLKQLLAVKQSFEYLDIKKPAKTRTNQEDQKEDKGTIGLWTTSKKGEKEEDEPKDEPKPASKQDEAIIALETAYQNAQKLYYEGKSIKDFREAAEAFEQLGDYKDARILAECSRNKERELESISALKEQDETGKRHETYSEKDKEEEKKKKNKAVRTVLVLVAVLALGFLGFLIAWTTTHKETDPTKSGEDRTTEPWTEKTTSRTEEATSRTEEATSQTETPTEATTAAPTTVAPETDAPTEPDPEVMSHADYIAAAVDDPVVVEFYVQDTQSWWANKITVYGADKDGGYFVYNMACSEEDAKRLVPGTKIRVTGFKAEWGGEIEIAADATFEFVDGATYVAEAKDLTDLLGKDELVDHQNELALFKGLKVVEVSYKNTPGSDDIYLTVEKDGATYSFCMEYYLRNNETDAYKAVQTLNAGDIIDIEAYLYWYNGPNPHIVEVKIINYRGDQIVIGGGDSLGTMYQVAVTIADTFSTNINGMTVVASTTSGSNEHALRIHEGQIALGLCIGTTALEAVNGTGKFADKGACSDLRAIGAIYPLLSHWVSLQGRYLHNVNSHSAVFGVGPGASITETTALLGLATVGLNSNNAYFRNVTLGDGVDQVSHGSLIASSAFAGIPVTSFLGYDNLMYLGFSDSELDQIVNNNPAYYKTAIPAGTYNNQQYDVPTFGVKVLLICRDDLGFDEAYQMAKTLYEQADSLSQRSPYLWSMADKSFIATELPIELHPGAKAFYKEVGLIP